jgi:transglutaminase-like putative cysteine protease
MLGGARRISLLLLMTAHALVLSGLVCVILTGEIPVALWVLALAAHPVSTLIKPSQGRYFLNSIVLLALSYSLFLFFVLQTPFLVAFTQFLIVVQAVKLFHLDIAKDYFQLAGLSLLTVLAAAGLTSQLYYLFFLFALLLIGIWFLFLLHLKRDMEQRPALPAPPRSLTAPSLFLGITGVALCSFIITIIIFFALPRMTLSVSGREQWSGTSSGFSESVDLGNVGPVRLDNRVVMRVEIPQFHERPSFPLYWRGTSFASWDGQSWKKGDIVERLPRRRGRGISFERPSPALHSTVIDQTIMLEPLGTDLLFFLNPPLEIRGRFSHLLIDQGDGIHLPAVPQERYYYEVSSAAQTRGGAYPIADEQPDDAYLQLPEKKKEIVTLAREIVAGTTAPEVKAERVVSYLQTHYTYSLDPKRDWRYLPLDDFLLHSREGYCEHFATAAALLLRATGVPTRLVSGFLQGEWNVLGRYFMVRQRDAHTWIEVSVPGKGWISYDPTPAAASQQASPFLGLSLYRYYDFLKLKWNRYIVQYTRRDQIRFLLTLRQKIMTIRLFPQASPLQGARERTASSPKYLFAALAGIALALLLVWMLRQKKKAFIRADRRLPAEIHFYMKILKILERKKINKRAAETPAEFAARVGHRHRAISPWLQRGTSLYYQVRFGLIPLSPLETAEVADIIKTLQKTSPIHQVKP